MIKQATLACVSIFVVGLIFIGCSKEENRIAGDQIKDIDGNIYHTVKIGSQTWMLENLRTTRYRNGETIPLVTVDQEWEATTLGAYCNYGHDVEYVNAYGRLYNWYAIVDSRSIAPKGWHIPNREEWDTLFAYLGGHEVAGGILKETGTVHWNDPNIEATNESGFTALPGGARNTFGQFAGLGQQGVFWTHTSYNQDISEVMVLMNVRGRVDHTYVAKNNGFTVRCIKDN